MCIICIKTIILYLNWFIIRNTWISIFRVRFQYCPIGYCCSQRICPSIDCCASKRTGRLCGKCMDGNINQHVYIYSKLPLN